MKSAEGKDPKAQRIAALWDRYLAREAEMRGLTEVGTREQFDAACSRFREVIAEITETAEVDIIYVVSETQALQVDRGPSWFLLPPRRLSVFPITNCYWPPVRHLSARDVAGPS